MFIVAIVPIIYFYGYEREDRATDRTARETLEYDTSLQEDPLLSLSSEKEISSIKKDIKLLKDSCPDCNVVLISVDSLRADHVSAYGYKRETTPNFDKIAQKGALFLDYFAASFLTPVSEMSVHTGLYPSSHGVTNFNKFLPEDRITLAQYMKKRGYSTSALMSSPEFEVNLSLKESFSRGFDRYEYVGNLPISRAYPVSDDLKSELDSFGKNKFFWWLAIGGVHWPYGEFSSDVFVDVDYGGILKDKELSWNEFQNIYKGVHYPEGLKLDKSDIRYVRDQYDNGVKAFDGFLGNLFSELDQRKLIDNTIIVIQSEHGEGLHEHGYFAHYDVMDTQVHTPLLILYPHLKEGMRISSFAGSVDVLPTIMELLGVEVPDKIQGKSLAPIIMGKEPDGLRQEAFIERSPLWEEAHLGIRDFLKGIGVGFDGEEYKDIAIRTPKYKYILRISKERLERISWWGVLTGQNMMIPEAELYNLSSDPLEIKNVINQYPDEAVKLRKRLEEWFAGISTSLPPKVDSEQEIQPYF